MSIFIPLTTKAINFFTVAIFQNVPIAAFDTFSLLPTSASLISRALQIDFLTLIIFQIISIIALITKSLLFVEVFAVRVDLNADSMLIKVVAV